MINIKRAASASIAVLVLAGAAGCGGDSSGSDSTAPAITIPSVTAPTATTPKPPATTTGTTRTKTAQTRTTFNPNAPDSQSNDVPPPKGSPQEQFEQQCNQNPQACG